MVLDLGITESGEQESCRLWLEIPAQIKQTEQECYVEKPISSASFLRMILLNISHGHHKASVQKC
jgi:hypothetical protein